MVFICMDSRLRGNDRIFSGLPRFGLPNHAMTEFVSFDLLMGFYFLDRGRLSVGRLEERNIWRKKKD